MRANCVRVFKKSFCGALMQLPKTIVRSAGKLNKTLNDKELALLSEIGLDQIPAATNFVEFFSQSYGASPSGVWYTLKKLKKERVVDFTEKGEAYKPLSLTENGISILRQNSAIQKTKILNRPITAVGGL